MAVQWLAITHADVRATFDETADHLALLGRLVQGWAVVAGLAGVLVWWGRYLARSWLIGAAWSVWLVAVVPASVATALGVSGAEPWALWIPVALAAGGCIALRKSAGKVVVPVVVLAVLVDLPPLTPRPSSAPAAASAAPIVLITLDTVRADHLGAISGKDGPVRTPSLDTLAARGWLFTQGVAPAPLTGPSHAGMLTGKPPHDLRMFRNGDALPTDTRTVAEALHDAGWRTGAFVSSAVLDRRTALEQGFDHYDDRFDTLGRVWGHLPWSTARVLRWSTRPAMSRGGAETVARALRWLEEPSIRPTFLWVHLYDAHAPYAPPEPYRTVPRAGTADAVAGWAEWRQTWLSDVPPFPALSSSRIEQAVADYAGEVAYVDSLVGELVAGAPDGTRWVVAADHGESLVEHGYVLNHGRHVFEVTSRVPIVVVVPDQVPARLDHPVPSWLVGATVSALAGLPTERSLLDERARPFREPIVTFTPGQESRRVFDIGQKRAELAWRVGADKWIVAADRSWRFDLRTDPEERRPEPTDDPTSAAARLLLDTLSSRPGPRTSDWLRALGYAD